MNVYPQSSGDFAALMAAISPILIWALSGMIRAVSFAQERETKRWDRISELASIMYNKGHEHGSWKQVIAVSELGTQIARRHEALEVLNEAKDFWKDKPISPALKSAVDRSIHRLNRFMLIRLLNP